MPKVTEDELCEQWEKLAEKSVEVADAFLHEIDLGDQNDQHFGVKLSAVAVMCRTVNHFMGMRLLMEKEMIVEARIMARCCYENLFWIGGLTKKGVAFLDQMSADNASSKLTLGTELLAWGKKNGGALEGHSKLKAFMEELKALPKGKIVHQSEALGSGLGAGYTIYRVLSGDAAHPSAVSISRHVKDEEDGSLTISGPSLWIDGREDIETWELGCSAFLSVCIGTNTILGNGDNSELTGLFATHSLLSGIGAKLAKDS